MFYVSTSDFFLSVPENFIWYEIYMFYVSHKSIIGSIRNVVYDTYLFLSVSDSVECLFTAASRPLALSLTTTMRRGLFYMLPFSQFSSILASVVEPDPRAEEPDPRAEEPKLICLP